MYQIKNLWLNVLISSIYYTSAVKFKNNNSFTISAYMDVIIYVNLSAWILSENYLDWYLLNCNSHVILGTPCIIIYLYAYVL